MTEKGKKFCRSGKHWLAISGFGPSALERDGRRTTCYKCAAKKAKNQGESISIDAMLAHRTADFRKAVGRMMSSPGRYKMQNDVQGIRAVLIDPTLSAIVRHHTRHQD